MNMNQLRVSVQLDEDKMEQESVEEMEQQVSDDEEKNTLLVRRTRSARASSSPADSYFPKQSYWMTLVMNLLTDIIT
jgi:hypothetical protein